jgi:hypothetical protein
MSITLIRAPCSKCDGTGRTPPVPPWHNGYACDKYDYVTTDGRWKVQSRRGQCGYGHGGPRWTIIDTTGEYETEAIESLDFARGYITEVIAESS